MSQQQSSLGFLLADASRLMRAKFQEYLKDSPLTLAQARTLVHVSRDQGIRQVDLAARLEIQPITLGRLIDQLSELGVVERRSCPEDRRAYRLYLTQRADPYLETIKRVSTELQRQALVGLSESEVETVTKGLHLIARNFSHELQDQGHP